MSTGQHWRVMFLLVVYVNQNYVLCFRHDAHARSCDFPRDVMLGFGDVRVQSCGCQRYVWQGGGGSRALHYGFCLGLQCHCG